MPNKDDLGRVDEPRALDLNKYQFNFRVGIGQRIAARYGAPAFAERTRRLERRLEHFWEDLETRREQLWVAAGEGRIAEDGRETRQVLLTARGTDPIGARDHRKRLFSARKDEDAEQRIAFNRAWQRHLGACGLAELQQQVADYVKWFPVEANLVSDPATGEYIWAGRPWVPPKAPTKAEVLERFPLA
jgi:hypothetical protein